ncbi:MAG: type II toxin-antitoxin system VapB family antitoxin [Thermodesulfobacteriota bacterium]|nr:type II toxin-antitoxin system VapB family antitoxin [Thermodesulfobacteriota bacterium]
MRTTVTLDEALLRELMRFSNAKTKTAAVSLAVKDGIRRAKLKQLASLLGTVDIDEKAIEESNEADMKRAQWLGGIGKENDR